MLEIEISDQTRWHFQRALEKLNAAGIPFVLGGAYAVCHYTGILRGKKGLDLFVVPRLVDDVLVILEKLDFDIEIEETHWLAEAHRDDYRIRVIYGSGNWLDPIDEGWIRRSEEGILFGVPVRFAPVDDMIWSKAYVSARYRYDGSDIVHLINAAHDRIDWDHLVRRFGEHWDLLLFHLLTYRYVYPSERDKVPPAIVGQLVDRLNADRKRKQVAPTERVCMGTLIDRTSFNVDILHYGFLDPREQLATQRGYPVSLVTKRRKWQQQEAAAKLSERSEVDQMAANE